MHPTSKKTSLMKIFLFGAVLQLLIYAGPWGSEVWAQRTLTIGLLQEPQTLNTWSASDRWSRKVLELFYQPLYIRDSKNLKLIPWLAQDDPVYDSATLSYTIKLRPAKWSDGSELTSEDVAFTGKFIKKFKVPLYFSNWRFVKKIETPDKHTVRLFLKEPKSVFLTRTLATPIVPKKEWIEVAAQAGKTENPRNSVLEYQVEKPLSSGPFILKKWQPGNSILLEKNNHFFGKNTNIGGHPLGPHIDGILFKIFSASEPAVMALKNGGIDMFWWGIQPEHLKEFKKDEKLQIYSSERSALYYLGFNVRKRPFKDINFRRAVATLIDKDYLITEFLKGNALKMNSVVPPGNAFWYYPDVPRHGEGLSREARIRQAYEILRKTGYTWEQSPVGKDGNLVKGKGIILPNGGPMEDFTILTPTADYDPYRFKAGIMTEKWLRMLGIPATSKAMEFRSLIHLVKDLHQFDIFVLGYGKLSLDPDYMRNFFHSRNDRPRGWNMSGYKNPDYDRIADESAGAMIPERRRELIWKMQNIIMHDVPYFPLYNPRLIEGVRSDRFTGWVQMLGGIGNMWSFCRIRPQ